MLRLYYADVSRLDCDAPGACLSPYRRQKLKQLRAEDKRRQSIGAELLLRQALADCAPEVSWPPEITAGPFGKPQWNVDGLFFNLSHSGRLAACAIADRPVGLDVQKDCPYREALVRRFFAPDEQKALAASTERDRDFGRLWTLKESWLKALGTGLNTPLASFSVVGEGGEGPEAAFWYTYLEGCHFALCIAGALSAQPDTIIKQQLP